jgi:nucleotide-binding universal stress UspA family protein
MEQLEAGAASYLGRISSRLQETSLNVSTFVQWGPAAEVIVDYSDRMGIEHIVMATHGYSGISRWRHGSVAERVLQSASVPVLMVCAQHGESAVQEPTAYQRILVPLDGSTTAEQVLPPTIAVAQAFDSEIVLFRVPIAHISGSLSVDWYLPLEGTFETAHQIAGDYLHSVAGELRAQGVKVSTALRNGRVAHAIIDYSETNQIDLIAMCTHGRTGLVRWTLGSVADRVLRAHSIPLLLVRAR